MENLQATEREEFNKDVLWMAEVIQSKGEDGALIAAKFNLLELSFQELIAGNLFTSMSYEKRKELFNQYEALKFLLSELDSFVEKYPEMPDFIYKINNGVDMQRN